MILSIALLIAGLALILLAAEFFTNGVEHLGEKLNLGEGAVGSVLAAVGTAMPETLVPIVAILFSKGTSNHEIGLGGIIGAPFMLSTLAMTITALTAFGYRGRRSEGSQLCVNKAIVSRDLFYFLPMYGAALGAAWLPIGPLRWLVCLLLLGGYAHYVRANLKESGLSVGGLKPLRFHALWVHLSITRLPEETREAFLHRRKAVADNSPHTLATIAQVVIALIIMLAGARVFVDQVKMMSDMLGISSLIVALVLVPIATELPEKFNSFIWIKQGKDTLALGNITGAMVFQSSFPVSVGILFTKWELNNPMVKGHSVLISAGIALFAAAFILACALRGRNHEGRSHLSPWVLLVGLPLYVLFILALKFQW